MVIIRGVSTGGGARRNVPPLCKVWEAILCFFPTDFFVKNYFRTEACPSITFRSVSNASDNFTKFSFTVS